MKAQNKMSPIIIMTARNLKKNVLRNNRKFGSFRTRVDCGLNRQLARRSSHAKLFHVFSYRENRKESSNYSGSVFKELQTKENLGKIR